MYKEAKINKLEALRNEQIGDKEAAYKEARRKDLEAFMKSPTYASLRGGSLAEGKG